MKALTRNRDPRMFIIIDASKKILSLYHLDW